MRTSTHFWIALVAVLVVGGLSDLAVAGKPNPQGQQAGKFVVLGNGWVLDTTTSLRWQQTPGDPTDDTCGNTLTCTWIEAWDYCEALGARLPGRKELESLLDLSQSNPALPDGHPFVDENGDSTVQSAFYWSASSNAFNPSNAWVVDFIGGNVGSFVKGGVIHHAWCVRGNQAFDGQNIIPPAP